MSALCEVIILLDFSLFFVYHRKSHNTHHRVLLTHVTLNFMDKGPWELLTQELTRPGPSPIPDHANTEISSFIMKHSLACTHLCECQKMQNDNVSLTYSLATSGTLQKINMSTEEVSRTVIARSTRSQNSVISG